MTCIERQSRTRTAFVLPVLLCRSRRTTSVSHRPFSMSTQAAQLRHRIGSIQSAEKIVSALRLVAAARIRSSSNAALRARPFADQLQTFLAELIRVISDRRIDIPSQIASAPPFSLADMHGPFLADPVVQKALLDRMYLALLSTSSPPLSIPSNLVTIVTVITADRKFCGSYNKDILTRAAFRIRSLEESGTRIQLFVVGRIARAFFSRHFPHIPIILYLPISRPSTPEQTATTLSHSLLSEFIAGGVQRVEIVYTRFVSLISTAPSTRTLLPIAPTGIEAIGDEIFELTLTSRHGHIVPVRTKRTLSSAADSNFWSPRPGSVIPSDSVTPSIYQIYDLSDQDAVLLLNSMLPMYVTSQLIRIVREAVASEQVSRLAAMSAATDNARELVSRLRTQYNKQRQARITTELIEVISSTTTP